MDINGYEFGDEMGIMMLSMDPQEILGDACDTFAIRYTHLKAQLALRRGSKYEALCTLRQVIRLTLACTCIFPANLCPSA